MHCEVCGQSGKLVLDLGLHPLCDDLIEIGSTKECTLYPIKIFYCENCRTAHNFCQIDKQTLFPDTYHYRSRFTSDVLCGMEDLLDQANTVSPLKSKKILDIGCNDGSMLDIALKKFNCKTYGIEPTAAALEARLNGHIVEKNYFDKDTARQFVLDHGHPDILTFTNVFAHISNLDGLLDGVKELIKPSTLLVIENHYLGGVVEKNQFDTFYHEHPRTYSLMSFVHIAKRLGLKIIHASFPKRYGGNVRIFMRYADNLDNFFELETLLEKDRICDGIFSMQEKVDSWIHNKGIILRSLAQKFGPLPAKAFPGRSAILFRLLKANTTLISGCFEKDHSLKVGYYVPGSRICIYPESTLRKSISSFDMPIINSAWHISPEIKTYIKQELGLPNPIVDLIEISDFD